MILILPYSQTLDRFGHQYALLNEAREAASWHRYLHPSNVPGLDLKANAARGHDAVAATLGPHVLRVFTKCPAYAKLKKLHRAHRLVIIRANGGYNHRDEGMPLAVAAATPSPVQWLHIVALQITDDAYLDDFATDGKWACVPQLTAGGW